MIQRKIVCLFIVGLVILCADVQLGLAQRPGAFISRPAKLRLESSTRRRFPQFYNRAFHGESLVTEEFYPIGWSKDGKFAYYSEPGDEACGCYFAKLVILDLVTDKAVWSFEYDGTEVVEQKGAPKSIAALWRQNRKLFSDKLREHRIKPKLRSPFRQFPISHLRDRIGADVQLKEKTDEDSRLYGTVTRATVQLISRRNGKKTIWDHTFSEATEMFPLDVDVVGFVRSPFEDRIATVVIEIYRGYEGPPHVTNIRIVGASLSSGFK